MKRRATKVSAFSKPKAGLDDAIAFHRGDRQLTIRDVELMPPPPMGAKAVLEESLRPAGITQVELAARMGVPIQRANGVMAGRRAVTAETAILLLRALGTTAALWLNLQMAVDHWDAEHKLGPARPARRRAVRGHGTTSAHG